MTEHQFARREEAATDKPEENPETSSISPQTQPLWTVTEVARYLRLEPGTVRSMARGGEIPGIKVGNQWRFRPASLKSWLLEQETLLKSDSVQELNK